MLSQRAGFSEEPRRRWPQPPLAQERHLQKALSYNHFPKASGGKPSAADLAQDGIERQGSFMLEPPCTPWLDLVCQSFPCALRLRLRDTKCGRTCAGRGGGEGYSNSSRVRQDGKLNANCTRQFSLRMIVVRCRVKSCKWVSGPVIRFHVCSSLGRRRSWRVRDVDRRRLQSLVDTRTTPWVEMSEESLCFLRRRISCLGPAALLPVFPEVGLLRSNLVFIRASAPVQGSPRGGEEVAWSRDLACLPSSPAGPVWVRSLGLGQSPHRPPCTWRGGSGRRATAACVSSAALGSRPCVVQTSTTLL